MQRRHFLCWLALAVWIVAGARAAEFIPLSIDEMARKSTLIVQGTVKSKTCLQDEAGRIYTRVELEVADVWKGALKQNPLVIVHGGGQVGSRVAHVSGQVDYEPGRETVAFLTINARGEAVTLGLAQGQFHVFKDSAGVAQAYNVFHGAAPAAEKSRQLLEDRPARPLTVQALKQQVKEAAQ